MKSRVSIVGVVVVAAACGGQATAPPASQPPATSAPMTTAAAPAGAGFGVPECDDYISKYLACIDSKVPEASRSTLRQQLDQTKDQWRQAASTSEGRAGLAVGCKEASDGAKAALAAYGCTF